MHPFTQRTETQFFPHISVKQNAGYFSQLPESLILIIANLLEVSDLIQFSYACKFIHHLLVAKIRPDFYSPAYIEHQLERINHDQRIKWPFFYPKNETFLKEQKWQHLVCLELDEFISKVETSKQNELAQWLRKTEIPLFLEEISILERIFNHPMIRPKNDFEFLERWREFNLESSKIMFKWKKIKGKKHCNVMEILRVNQELQVRYYAYFEGNTEEFTTASFNLQTIQKNVSSNIKSLVRLSEDNKKIIENYLFNFFVKPPKRYAILYKNFKENAGNVNYMRVIDIWAYYLDQYPEKMKTLLNDSEFSSFKNLLDKNTISKLLISSYYYLCPTYNPLSPIYNPSASISAYSFHYATKISLCINLNRADNTFLESEDFRDLCRNSVLKMVFETAISASTPTDCINLINHAFAVNTFSSSYFAHLCLLISRNSLLRESIKQSIMTALHKSKYALQLSIKYLERQYQIPHDSATLYQCNGFEKMANLWMLNALKKILAEKDVVEKNGIILQKGSPQLYTFIPHAYGCVMNNNTLFIGGAHHESVKLENNQCEKYSKLDLNLDLVPSCNIIQFFDVSKAREFIDSQITAIVQSFSNRKRKIGKVPEHEQPQRPAKKLKSSGNSEEAENSAQDLIVKQNYWAGFPKFEIVNRLRLRRHNFRIRQAHLPAVEALLQILLNRTK